MGRKRGYKAMNDYERGYGDWGYEGYGGTHHAKSYTPKKGWDTGDAPKVCTNCDFHSKDAKQKITVTYPTWQALMALCMTIKVEWQALLSGTIDADGVVRITGYYIPKQQVGPSFVKNLDVIDDVFIREHSIVAGVHSHANMACFFSSTDHDDTNMSLIKHNIVVNNKGEYKATSRVELPCSMVKFIDAEVFTVGEPDVVLEGVERIEQRTYAGFSPAKWGKKVDGDIDGTRWCPLCDMVPEEDQGVSCLCWTKGARAMLPSFTRESYEHTYGRTWSLKTELEKKYGAGSGDKKKD